MANMPYEKGLDMLSGLFASLCCTEDAEAGVTAFLERKRRSGVSASRHGIRGKTKAAGSRKSRGESYER